MIDHYFLFRSQLKIENLKVAFWRQSSSPQAYRSPKRPGYVTGRVKHWVDNTSNISNNLEELCFNWIFDCDL